MEVGIVRPATVCCASAVRFCRDAVLPSYIPYGGVCNSEGAAIRCQWWKQLFPELPREVQRIRRCIVLKKRAESSVGGKMSSDDESKEAKGRGMAVTGGKETTTTEEDLRLFETLCISSPGKVSLVSRQVTSLHVSQGFRRTAYLLSTRCFAAFLFLCTHMQRTRTTRTHIINSSRRTVRCTSISHGIIFLVANLFISREK